MNDSKGAFWDDLAEDLKDPEFRKEYVKESVRIATIDRMVNELDQLREEASLSKAKLARAMNAEPAAIRRIFSAHHVNPTLGTLAEIAAALGMRVTLEPLDKSERASITEPLRGAESVNTKALAKSLTQFRSAKTKKDRVHV